MNAAALQKAVAAFLEALGEPVRSETDLARTPERVAEAWANELLSGYAQDPRAILTWDEVEGEQGLIAVQAIDFQSVCVHHLLPFTGKASIAYLPDRRQAGLSKLARLVDCLSRRLQLQERLTAQILDAVVAALSPRGAACLIQAEHQCMSCRGVRRPNARVVTVRAHGACTEEPLRGETMRLLAPARD